MPTVPEISLIYMYNESFHYRCHFFDLEMTFALLAFAAAVAGPQHESDPRSIFNGTTMVVDGYLDQPCVKCILLEGLSLAEL
jgi:hypothetical protein